MNIFVLSRIVRHTVVFARTFTARWLSLRVYVTPCGTCTGCLPMRDSFASTTRRTEVVRRVDDCEEIVASPRANVDTCEASIANLCARASRSAAARADAPTRGARVHPGASRDRSIEWGTHGES